jgi:hypothetical protein
VIGIIGHPIEENPDYAPLNVADLEARDSHFWSKNQPNEFITYDFKEMTVLAKQYAIRSTSEGAKGHHHLKSWVVEVSEDGEEWVEVDRRVDDQNLNGRAAVAVFVIAVPVVGRFIRLRQIDVNHCDNPMGAVNSLVLSAWEIFGDLFG